MLVLVSFGLVLLATILLVVGLLADDGLTLIYLSIASSFTAALVLYLAFRRAKPKAETGSVAPAPLPDDIAPTASPVMAAPATPTAAPAPVAVADATQTMDAPAAPAPAAAAPVEEAAEEGWADDDDWADDDGWEDEGGAAADEFPIADYDDLKVAEIMPLLPQLYSDELEFVAERERAGKNRSTILSRLEELAASGTEADRLEADEVTDDAPVAVAEPAPVAAEPEPEPVAEAAADEDAAGWDDEEYFFPIADYDDLTVGQIMPLLPQLELDELEEVKEREVAGQARKSLLSEIDRYLSGELEVVGWEGEEDDDDWAESTPAPAAAAPPTMDEDEADDDGGWDVADDDWAETDDQTAAADDEEPWLPIAEYDTLTVAQIRPLLPLLDEQELREVLEHESANADRATITDDIERRLGIDTPAQTAPVRKAPAKKARAKKAGTRKSGTRKAGTKKARAKKAPARTTGTKKAAATKAAARTSTRKAASKKSSAKKSTAKKATAKKSTAKKSGGRFPIADYDELTVADIRPRLTSLSDRQLALVRDREEKGAGRKTILADIANRLD